MGSTRFWGVVTGQATGPRAGALSGHRRAIRGLSERRTEHGDASVQRVGTSRISACVRGRYSQISMNPRVETQMVLRDVEFTWDTHAGLRIDTLGVS